VCDTCGANFNICNIDRDGYKMEPLMPPASGKCDDKVCKIVQRADDTEAVISNRMVEYEEKTAPLLNAY
jgi:adenylate kinase